MMQHCVAPNAIERPLGKRQRFAVRDHKPNCDAVRHKALTDAQLLAADPGPHALRQIAVPNLSVAYGLTRDLTISARLPYLANRGIRELDGDSGTVVDRGGVYGFGDTTITGTWRFHRDAHLA